MLMMVRLARRGLLALSLAGSVAVGVSTPAAACTGPVPTLAEVAATAHYIVVATVAAKPAPNDWAMSFLVRRTLAGDVSGTLAVKNIRTSLCGDGVAAGAGQAVIFARGLAYHGRTLDAYWVFTNAGKLIEASVMGNQPETLNAVIRDILGALPNTAAAPATAEAAPAAPGLLGGAAIALAALGAALALEVRRRRPRPVR
jgi:hypothetical protein